MREFLEQAYAAMCDAEERCAPTHGRNYSSKEACNEQYRAFIDQLPEIFADIQIRDASKKQPCIDALRTADCDAQNEPQAVCDEAIAVSSDGQVGENQVCHAPGTNEYKSCEQGFVCRQSSSQPACQTCQRLAANGAPCDSSSYCESDYCDDTCQAHPDIARGSACTSTTECKGNLVCVGQAGKTCEERRGIGQTCQYDCYYDLRCVNNGGTATCQAPLAHGAQCTRSQAAAGCAVACIFTAADAPTGTCSPVYESPGAGQPCAYSYGSVSCDYETSYADETEDNEGNATACVCKPRAAAGASCSSSIECATGVCKDINYTTNPPTPGTCAEKIANGSDCYYDSMCASGYCSTSSTPAKCAAPPECQ